MRGVLGWPMASTLGRSVWNATLQEIWPRRGPLLMLCHGQQLTKIEFQPYLNGLRFIEYLPSVAWIWHQSQYMSCCVAKCGLSWVRILGINGKKRLGGDHFGDLTVILLVARFGFRIDKQELGKGCPLTSLIPRHRRCS